MWPDVKWSYYHPKVDYFLITARPKDFFWLIPQRFAHIWSLPPLCLFFPFCLSSLSILNPFPLCPVCPHFVPHICSISLHLSNLPPLLAIPSLSLDPVCLITFLSHHSLSVFFLSNHPHRLHDDGCSASGSLGSAVLRGSGSSTGVWCSGSSAGCSGSSWRTASDLGPGQPFPLSRPRPTTVGLRTSRHLVSGPCSLSGHASSHVYTVRSILDHH